MIKKMLLIVFCAISQMLNANWDVESHHDAHQTPLRNKCKEVSHNDIREDYLNLRKPCIMLKRGRTCPGPLSNLDSCIPSIDLNQTFLLCIQQGSLSHTSVGNLTNQAISCVNNGFLEILFPSNVLINGNFSVQFITPAFTEGNSFKVPISGNYVVSWGFLGDFTTKCSDVVLNVGISTTGPLGTYITPVNPGGVNPQRWTSSGEIIQNSVTLFLQAGTSYAFRMICASANCSGQNIFVDVSFGTDPQIPNTNVSAFLSVVLATDDESD